MAIYHLSVKIIGCNAGRSSVAAVAYRSGDTLTNEYDGITHDYSLECGGTCRKIQQCSTRKRG